MPSPTVTPAEIVSRGLGRNLDRLATLYADEMALDALAMAKRLVAHAETLDRLDRIRRASMPLILDPPDSLWMEEMKAGGPAPPPADPEDDEEEDEDRTPLAEVGDPVGVESQ